MGETEPLAEIEVKSGVEELKAGIAEKVRADSRQSALTPAESLAQSHYPTQGRKPGFSYCTFLNML